MKVYLMKNLILLIALTIAGCSVQTVSPAYQINIEHIDKTTIRVTVPVEDTECYTLSVYVNDRSLGAVSGCVRCSPTFQNHMLVTGSEVRVVFTSDIKALSTTVTL